MDRARAKPATLAGNAMTLPYPRELKPFIERSPLPVLVRSCLEWLIDEPALETLFRQTAQRQYTRELTLDFIADTMLDVACGIHPTASAALTAYEERMTTTRQAFYAKLQRMEPGVGEAIVQHVAALTETVMAQWGMAHYEPVPGFQVRVLDGAHLGGRTEHRIKPLRQTNSAGLTGVALAVYSLATHLVLQVVLEEDAYTQERALLTQLDIGAGQLWIADRNFCVRAFLFRIAQAHSCFLMRWHRGACPFEAVEPLREVAASRPDVKEQAVQITDPKTGQQMAVRRIELCLPAPTRDGDTTLVLMTNLPAHVAAVDLCELYRQRWQIETHYQRLTQQLHCEPQGLNHPRAALFAFAMAIVAGNALALVQAALRERHGREAVEELSYYYLVMFVASVWEGMGIAVPAEKWHFVRQFTAAQLALWLSEVAQSVRMDQLRRSRRSPKKPQPKRASGKTHHHVSIKRLLDAQS
jgi:Transposase DDE domain